MKLTDRIRKKIIINSYGERTLCCTCPNCKARQYVNLEVEDKIWYCEGPDNDNESGCGECFTIAEWVENVVGKTCNLGRAVCPKSHQLK